MFIYCGISDNRPRVLDTEDGVVESIDVLQFKALQAKGYEIVKDFSYDYAYSFYNYVSSILASYNKPWDYLYYNRHKKDEYHKIMDFIYEINTKFGGGIDKNIILNNRLSSVIISKGIGVIGVYITEVGNKYEVHALVAGINGVFFKHSGLRLKSPLSRNQDLDLFGRRDDYVKFSLYLEDSRDLLVIQIDRFGNIKKRWERNT